MLSEQETTPQEHQYVRAIYEDAHLVGRGGGKSRPSVQIYMGYDAGIRALGNNYWYVDTSFKIFAMYNEFEILVRTAEGCEHSLPRDLVSLDPSPTEPYPPNSSLFSVQMLLPSGWSSTAGQKKPTA